MSLRQRLGRPQIFALLLLFAFFLQTLWVAHIRPLARVELNLVRAGLEQFHAKPLDSNSAPVPTATAAFPVLVGGKFVTKLAPDTLKWLVRLPFITFGCLLGGSIWYVARRLYGNAGGYLALALYCFSPLTYFSFPSPMLSGSLGAFGMIFVSIAIAHTLYAPLSQGERDHFFAGLFAIHMRWRRVLLLALAIVLGVGSSYWLIFVLILAEAFMVYVVPDRQFSAVGIVASAAALAFVILWGLHGFHWHGYWTTIRGAAWLPFLEPGYRILGLRSYMAGFWRTGNPALIVLAAAALVSFAAYRRSRYFGNTVPLLVVLFMLGFVLLSRAGLYSGPFPVQALPFLFVFIAGVFADMLETELRPLVLLFTLVILGSYVTGALLELVRTRFSVLY